MRRVARSRRSPVRCAIRRPNRCIGNRTKVTAWPGRRIGDSRYKTRRFRNSPEEEK